MNELDASKAMDPFGVLDKVKAGEMRFLRPSMMGQADVCFKRLGYDLDPTLPRGTGEARIVGTAYHAGLEAYYRARTDGEIIARGVILAAAANSCEEESKDFDAWVTSSGEALNKVFSMLNAYFDGNHQWGPEYEILGVEWEWFLPLAGSWAIKGTGDLAVRGPEGVVLVDHKTAGRKWPKDKHNPRKAPQATIYPWAWWRCTEELPAGFAYDVMSYKGEFERRMAYATPAHMAAVLDKAVAITRMIDAFRDPSKMPGNPSSNLCSAAYCDHFLRCPLGAVLDSVSG